MHMKEPTENCPPFELMYEREDEELGEGTVQRTYINK